MACPRRCMQVLELRIQAHVPALDLTSSASWTTINTRVDRIVSPLFRAAPGLKTGRHLASAKLSSTWPGKCSSGSRHHSAALASCGVIDGYLVAQSQHTQSVSFAARQPLFRNQGQPQPEGSRAGCDNQANLKQGILPCPLLLLEIYNPSFI